MHEFIGLQVIGEFTRFSASIVEYLVKIEKMKYGFRNNNVHYQTGIKRPMYPK